MKLLLIEDDQQLTSALQPLLRDAGYALEIADNGIDGEFLGNELQPDLIILDLGLPGKSGLDVLRSWRASGNRTPVLVLTARDAWHERVDGLKAGADDYLTKPFHNEELLARVKALIRRASGQASSTIEFGPVVLDMQAKEIRVNARALDLTAYEYKVMEYLMLHPQKVISKTELTEHIYDQDFDLDSNVIEVFVGRLRRKLDPEGTLKPIETLRGRGYRISRELAQDTSGS